MIPKKIHYCWFGGNTLDDKSIHCIESWKKFFQGYEIVEWNESNFDISIMDFMKKAYADKKWAFVSDVVRLIVIYENGGIYFDTDVEVIAPYNDVLEESGTGFFAFETTGYINSGLGFAAESKHPFLKQLISTYERIDYDEYRDRLFEIACPIIQTKLMQNQGLIVENRFQKCCGFTIYPTEYFSPINYATGKINKTINTHSIHWYNASWNDISEQKKIVRVQKFHRLFGVKLGDMMLGICDCIKREGFASYVIRRLKKITRKL